MSKKILVVFDNRYCGSSCFMPCCEPVMSLSNGLSNDSLRMLKLGTGKKELRFINEKAQLHIFCVGWSAKLAHLLEPAHTVTTIPISRIEIQ